jgi:hypothetical protein
MNILPVVGVITVGVTLATSWCVGHRVSLHDLAMVAHATHSPRACVGFIRFCTADTDPDLRR